MKHLFLSIFALSFVCACAQTNGTIAVEDCFDPKGGHIQGMCRGNGFFYLTQMVGIYKIDAQGKCVAKTKAISHTGDVCWHDGKLYSSVAVYGGPEKGKGKIQVYDADLRLLKEKTYPRGLDGIAYLDGRLYVGQGSHLETVPQDANEEPQSKTPHLENELLIVDPETLEVIEKKVYSHGRKTRYGAQNIETDGTLLYFTFYPGEKGGPDFVAYDKDLQPVRQTRTGSANGIVFTGFAADGRPEFLKCSTRAGESGVSAVIGPVALPTATADSLRFMTFNIWGAWSDKAVAERGEGVWNTIRRQKPDILSLQEVTRRWWESDLLRELRKDYGVIRGDEDAALLRIGADLSKRKQDWLNFEPLAYRKDRLTLLDSGFEFFSLTLEPNKGVTWGVFEDRRSGKRFISFATHLWWQYNGLESHTIRELNARKILDILASVRTKWGEIPVIGGGDFNCNTKRGGVSPIVAFERAGYADAGKCADVFSSVPSEHGELKRGPDGRYHGKKGVIGQKGVAMIDRVFYTAGIHALRHDVDCTQETLDVSDHAPIVVDFRFR